ncbi:MULTISPECIES: signal peptidase II [unclassified Streptomyces]|uniref:signal peptidase II n=1 Tax=unclassified Streptomyces TaxID=2593676 RepID=UPI0006F69420|nr:MULTISPECIES: signal peptidase II [unclassified Streptomyces]KQX53377.1 signal peptidase II [Streptomyces sp. Root1304]KRA90295.1 signal peptidase II [Streptomyces sp. Root66D1]
MAEAERIIGTPDSASAGADDSAASEETVAAGGKGAPDATARPDGPAESDARATSAGTAAFDGTAAPDETAAAEERPKGRRRIVTLFVVAVLAYLLDLGSKMLVVAKLEGHEPIRVVGDLLRLDAIRNPGAAFGMGEAFTIIFTCIATAVIVVIIRLARKLYSLPWAIALGLLLGGALGNLTDRIFRSPGVFEGAVVDFIAPANFAVFNLADSAIVCGGILIVILSFRGLDPDGTIHKD